MFVDDYPVQIPHFQKGDTLDFKYYILTDDTYKYSEEDYLKVPHINSCVSRLAIQKCETNGLIIYRGETGLHCVPNHEIEYGTPYYKGKMEDCYDKKNWWCPQNFFISESKAKNVLDYIKNKVGTLSYDEIYYKNSTDLKYYIVSPYGKFNNI